MDYRNTRMWEELNAAPAILQTLAAKNAGVLDEIAKAAKGALNAYTVARGTSDHAMMYFKYLAESILRLPVASGAPSVVTVYNAALRLDRSLVVACSQSGKAADVMEVVRRANDCGAVTVAITNDESSPLAKLAKFHLCCFAEEEKSVAATKTFSAQLYLSMLLVSALAGQKEDFSAFLHTFSSNVPAIDAATDAAAAEFISAEECFLLSRGISAALAFEAGLKLQETCYIKARAYHSSDFYHGPMAMVGKGTKIVLFASRRALNERSEQIHREDYVKCAQKMLELGADLFIVTDDEGAFSGMAAKIIPVAGGGDERLTAFYFALAAQMLACKVSCGKGLNPDSPRALKKVTITK